MLRIFAGDFKAGEIEGIQGTQAILRPEAIAHSLAAEDWERVAQLIDKVVNDVMTGGA